MIRSMTSGSPCSSRRNSRQRWLGCELTPHCKTLFFTLFSPVYEDHQVAFEDLCGLPAHGDKVTIALWVCRWRCLASTCPRRTFSDYTSSIARPFARRTSRADDIVGHLGHTTGGRPAERLLRRSGVGVSNDTVLRHLKQLSRCP